MDSEERQMLIETHTNMKKIREAFFEVPEGSPDDEKPLIEGIRIMWRAYQRKSWVFRLAVWLIPTIAGVLIALDRIEAWIRAKF